MKFWMTKFRTLGKVRSRSRFFSGVRSLRASTMSAVQTAQSSCPTCDEILITGHSLGASMATILAGDSETRRKSDCTRSDRRVPVMKRLQIGWYRESQVWVEQAHSETTTWYCSHDSSTRDWVSCWLKFGTSKWATTQVGVATEVARIRTAATPRTSALSTWSYSFKAIRTPVLGFEGGSYWWSVTFTKNNFLKQKTHVSNHVKRLKLKIFSILVRSLHETLPRLSHQCWLQKAVNILRHASIFVSVRFRALTTSRRTTENCTGTLLDLNENQMSWLMTRVQSESNCLYHRRERRELITRSLITSIVSQNILLGTISGMDTMIHVCIRNARNRVNLLTSFQNRHSCSRSNECSLDFLLKTRRARRRLKSKSLLRHGKWKLTCDKSQRIQIHVHM